MSPEVKLFGRRLFQGPRRFRLARRWPKLKVLGRGAASVQVRQHQQLVSINNWSASTIGQHQQFVSINNWSASIIGQHQLFVSINNWSASTICQHQYQWRSISNQQSAAAVQIINQHQQFVSFYNYILTLQCESHIYLCKCFLTRDIWDRKRRIQYSPY